MIPDPDTDAEQRWARTRLAATLFAIDPTGTGGIWLRARSGPVRDKIRDLLDVALPNQTALHPLVSDAQLFGGIDLSQTFSTSKVVASDGLLTKAGVFRLAMAERCGVGFAARVAQAMDLGGRALIALDEGAEPEEALVPALAERVGLFIHLEDIPVGATDSLPLDRDEIKRAQAALPHISIAPDRLEELVILAAQLGISSLRAPLFAKAAAMANAALFERNRVTFDDVQIAAELVYAHKATQFPQPQDQTDISEQPPEPQNAPDPVDAESETVDIPQDLLLEAVAASLPQNVLDMLAVSRSSRSSKGSGGAGASKKGNRRGRPLPSRTGKLGSDARIDLVATLRAAAPWQAIRAKQAPKPSGLYIRSADIRIKQFEETSDRLLIFVVDASGSAAMARLAEAKGAVELLLAEAYSRRDYVSLIAFRGDSAEVLLPPTRSLVQTKRRLAALPGGGGTPLAAGLQAAIEVSNQAKSKGMDPTMAILTDGRANIALDGSVNRTLAAQDATQLARLARGSGIPSLVIDTSNRPQSVLQDLAKTLDASYIAMPRADAERLSGAVSAALQD